MQSTRKVLFSHKFRPVLLAVFGIISTLFCALIYLNPFDTHVTVMEPHATPAVWDSKSGSHLEHYSPPCKDLEPPAPTNIIVNCNNAHYNLVDKDTYKQKGILTFTELPEEKRNRRVIDFSIFNTELDMLDVRLAELWDVVDIFVVFEAGMTFSGKRKTLYFDESRGRYAKFASKIVHIRVDTLKAWGAWGKEHQTRELLMNEGLRMSNAKAGDILILGDIDEMPKPDVIRTLKQCGGWEDLNPKAHLSSICLETSFHYYSYEWLQPVKWSHPDIAIYPGPGHKVDGTLFRQSPGDNNCIEHAGWHCSWCFPNLKMFKNKVQSYAHTEHNTQDVTSDEWIKEATLNGLDLMHRKVLDQSRIPKDQIDGPKWLFEHKNCYPYFLDRKIGITEPNP